MKEIITNDRQKKFLLVLPILVLPFMTLFFWALGGGKSANGQVTNSRLTGLNIQLPGAQLKNDSTENKLSFYQQAEKDSLKLKEAIKDDPYYKKDSSLVNSNFKDTITRPVNKDSNIGNAYYHSPLVNSSSRGQLESNEQQVNRKLALLKQQMNQPEPAPVTQTDNADNNQGQLRELMQKMNSGNTEDPEMKQLSGMLDKIMEIQHPELAREKIKQQSEKNKGQAFAVTAPAPENPVATLDNGNSTGSMSQQNGFYSFDNNMPAADSQNAIEAVVHETQTVTSGSTVKLRLVNDIYINGILIPKETFVFGIASLNGERLSVKVGSIRYRNSILPVDLSVYDMDGADGIYIPGAISRDVAKESADQSIQNLGFTTYDPSLGAQAASAGISAAKSLFSRKVRLVKVTVKAGYQVLLRDEKQKQSN